MGIIAAGQITVVDLSDAPVLNAFITASRPTTQTYSKDSRNYNPSYASTPQVLTLNVTKSGSTTSIIDSIRGLHWFVVDGSVKTEITSKVNTSNEYISGTYDENLTTKLNIDTTKGYRRYEATGVWRDPSTDLDVQFSANIDLLLTQNGATGPQGPQGDDGPQGPQGDKGETGNGIANTVVTYGLSMSDTTEPATWSSDRPALVKGMYLWTRTVIIYTNGESTTSYQISYIPQDGDASGEIDKTKQELLEKLETVRDDSLAAVEEAKEELTTVADDLSQAKQDLTSQAQQLQTQANAQSELTKRVSSVEETANGTKTTVSELSKTVAQNGKDITSVTARTKIVEDDLTSTKTTLSQVKTTADSTSQKTATLETGLNGVKADLAATTVTADTTKTNLANYQASNDRAVANLQSNIQEANGNISSLQTKVEAVPGQITSAVSAVEGKIPTNVSTRNLILKSNDFANPHKQNGNNTTVSSTDDYFVIRSTGYTANAWGGISWNMSIPGVKTGEQFSILMPVYIDSSINLDGAFSFELKRHNPNTRAYAYSIPTNKKDGWFNVAITFKISGDVTFDGYSFYVYLVKNGLVRIKPPMLVRGNIIPRDYQPAFEDAASDITKLNTTLTQTADGLRQLSTQVRSQGSTITSHTNSINSLTTGLNAKVSQTDFNTLSGRVTTAENNITAKANELSSKITSVEGKIPTKTGLRNYVLGTGTAKISNGGKLYDLSSAFDDIASGAPLILEFDWSVTAPTTTSKFRINRVITYSDGTADQWNNIIYKDGVSSDIITSSGTGHFSGTFHNVTYNGTTVSSRYLNLNQTTASGTVTISNLSIRVGSLKGDWQPASEDYDSKLATAQSEIKQTTDAIKASVSSLDNSTVKSSSLTINADGIVMKAGKSTTDVANAIGSYFAVNQNAINLFSDKIKVKGNMIVSGSISSDKISSSGITANVIKGGTLQSVNGSTNFELNTGKLFYNNNNTGVFRVQNGASTMGLKFSNTPITVSGTSRILSRIILGGDRNETTLDDGKWDKGGFSGLVIETIKGAIPAANEHADSLRAISDTIYFTHTYSADSPTGVSAHGWKMETYAPDSSYSGNIVLKPYGINYRQSDIVVGDVRLDNGDGSGYWMRATINTLKACFGHILNGGTSSQALNAIRSELNKISGI